MTERPSWRQGLRLLPRHIGSQIALLVLLAGIVTYAGNTLLLRAFEHPPGDGADFQASGILFAALPVLAETAPDKRQAIVDLVNLMAPRLDMSLTPDVEIPDGAKPAGPSAGPSAGQARVPAQDRQPPPDAAGAPPNDHLGGARLYSLGVSEDGTRRLDRTLAVLPDGAGIFALLPLPPEPRTPQMSFQFNLGNWLVLLVFVLPVALVWAVLGVSGPLRRFARAAEEFSLDGTHTPLPESGPEEIRIAARALNAMRQRIAIMAKDRTRMLSSVGHDLRTPVTRMRLRAEFITDDEIREGQLRDLSRMDAMIDQTLSFLRDGQAQGTWSAIDLVSLLQTVVDDFVDLDKSVMLIAPDRLVLTVEPESIRRMVENLTQNGLKFGSTVWVTLAKTSEGGAEIVVEDDGPGIPEAERADMLKPFVTGDAARSGTGFGLGLSIAEAISRAHGGTIALTDSAHGGLGVHVTLPAS